MGKQPRFEAVLFDLDGTLVNTVDLIVQSFQHVWRTKLGKELEADRARSFIGLTLRAAFEAEGLEDVDGLIADYTRWNLAHLPDLQQNYRGVPELLERLHAEGVVIGVVTAKRRPSALMSLQVAGLSDLIELTVSMEDTTKHKPDPTPLLLGATRLGLDPARTAYVGDTVFDVQAAKAAGMAAVAVTWGAGNAADLAGEGPDYCATIAEELSEALLGA